MYYAVCAHVFEGAVAVIFPCEPVLEVKNGWDALHTKALQQHTLLCHVNLDTRKGVVVCVCVCG